MKIKELILQTSKLDELYFFYKNVLQLNVVEQATGQFNILTPGTKLGFTKSDKGTDPAYHFAFNIPSNKIEQAHDWLKERVELLWMEDYKSDIADFVNWHAKSVYFIDAGGNIVEFIARFDLQDNESKDFSPSQIRNVSEIGIVFNNENFDADITAFMSKYSLAYFDKQPPLPQFRAIGSNDGLFICVPENRPWFPTKDVLASRPPMKVEWLACDKLYSVEI